MTDWQIFLLVLADSTLPPPLNPLKGKDRAYFLFFQKMEEKAPKRPKVGIEFPWEDSIWAKV
ncbi:hypothetical protein P3G55_10505 [Leptospira sp. 96542]|nr:hypothetical protein [Leptospira sp. 96542]